MTSPMRRVQIGSMPKKQKLDAYAKKSISEEIEKTVHYGLLVRSSLHGHFRKHDEVRIRWEKMMDEMLSLRSVIPEEIQSRTWKTSN